MAPRPPVQSDLARHRAAALASQSLMHATKADIHEIIRNTKVLINDGHEAMRRTDALLRLRKSGNPPKQ
jgi:hypothetical protein